MSSWRVAHSLDVLLEEINAAAPRRSKVSDGSIGDPRHQAGWTSSDHNPFVTFQGQGIVRARDFTHDPAGGLDCNDLAKALAALIAVGGHPACRSGAYVIWNRRILSFDRRGEGWRPYTGSNPHDHHCHISVALDPAGFDSRAMWGVMTEKDWFDMADKADLAEVVDKGTERILARLNRMGERQVQRQRVLLDEIDALADEKDMTNLKTKLKSIRQKVDAIGADAEE